MSRDDGFERLRNLFTADLAEKIKSLEAALREAKWDEVNLISHQITGTAKSFGYPEISSVASELEDSVPRRSIQKASDLVKRISDLIVL